MVVVLDTVAGRDARPRHPEKAHRPDTPVLRKPDWIRVKAPGSPVYRETTAIVREHGLVTVCEEAGCPNIGECWSKKHATFMIMGDTCTRACAFCNVRTGIPQRARRERAGAGRRRHRQARPQPRRHHLGRSRRPRRRRRGAFRAKPSPPSAAARRATIEILTPDFLRKDGAIATVVAAKPDVFNHNLETVPSKYLTVRPGARYFASLRLLQQVKELDPQMFTKSGIMVGLGEERNEVLQVMDDLRAANVDFLTIGQYLQPTRQAPSGRPLRHAGGVQGLRDDRLRQGLPDGLGEPADALVASRRRGFRAAARRARRQVRARLGGDAALRHRTPGRPFRRRDVRAGRRRRALSRVRAALPGAGRARPRRGRRPRGPRRRHDGRLQDGPRDLHDARRSRPPGARHRRRNISTARSSISTAAGRSRRKARAPASSASPSTTSFARACSPRSWARRSTRRSASSPRPSRRAPTRSMGSGDPDLTALFPAPRPAPSSSPALRAPFRAARPPGRCRRIGARRGPSRRRAAPRRSGRARPAFPPCRRPGPRCR